jgi:hypothetical protein
MKHFLFLILALCSLAACESLPNKYYATPIRAESLLDSSAERVSFGVTSPKSVTELTDWINKDQPSRAEISCNTTQPNCKKAQQVLSSFGVSYKTVTASSSTGNVVLIYNRVVTRSCDNGFVSNHHNSRNLNHPAFGCSVASNTLQMISDQQQILNPPLSGLQDAQTAVKHINAYRK